MPSTKRLDYLDKLSAALDAFVSKGNTVEEFGDLLHDATMRIDPPGWDDLSKTTWRALLERKATALRNLRELPHGREIIKEENKQ